MQQSSPRSTDVHAKLRTLLGDHLVTRAMKRGEIRSAELDFDFADVKVPNTAFKRVVRDLEFDVDELAIVTFLLARAHSKPLSLLPAVVTARFQHALLVHNAERGPLAPGDLAGRRIGLRSYPVTTAVWVRAVLADDYGVAPEQVQWVAFEEPHVAEYRDPPNVERAPAGKDLLSMLLEGSLDAAVVGERPSDPRLVPVIADPAAAAQAWHQRTGALQVNHMLVVKDVLAKDRPHAAEEIVRLFAESKRAAGLPAPDTLDMNPVGREANRRNLDVAIDCVYRQGMIARRFEPAELFA
jgi:4,5-dihydroxyphthalate decarboxylase